MMCIGDKEWTDKLQPAVLAANTQSKRSTGYTPFYLMFGRDFDSSKLLNLITSPNNPAFKPQPTIETKTELSHPNLTPMDIDEITDPYELPNNDNEWVETIAATRKTDKKNAKQNIKKEQKVQKKTYDRKVKRNRYVDTSFLTIHFVIVIQKFLCIFLKYIFDIVVPFNFVIINLRNLNE